MTEEYRALENVKLKKVEHINLQEALSTAVLSETQNKITFNHALKELIATLFFHQYKIKIHGKKKILFFFTSSYGSRKAFLHDYERVVECAKDYVSFSHRSHFHFNLERIIYLPLWVTWVKQLKVSSLSIAYRMYLANKVLAGYCHVKWLDRYIKRNNLSPNLGITFCDVHPVDYFIISYLSGKGIKTGTLQHAVFEHEKFGWAYSFSHSNYFLGISEVAKHEAILAGADIENFIILGPMKYIDSVQIFNKDSRLKTVGLALSGPAFEYENIRLFEYIQMIIDESDYTAIVRAHPALNMETYKKYFNQKVVFDDSESMSEFANKCEFVIMGATNTFADILVTDTYAFRLIEDVDFFGCIEDFKFQDYESLTILVNQLREEPNLMYGKLQKAKEKVCPTWDIKKAYCDFFENYNGVKDESKQN